MPKASSASGLTTTFWVPLHAQSPYGLPSNRGKKCDNISLKH